MKITLTHKRRLIAVIACGFLILLAGVGANVWYWVSKNDEINAQNQATQKSIEEADAKIQQIKEEKIAKEKQRQQAAQELAARAAQGDASAEGIDSAICNASKTHNNPAHIDVVVNKKHCLHPIGYEPNDLVTAHGATLSAKAMEAYIALYDAATAAGQPFYVTSSYRSYATQVSTYSYWVSTSGQAGADTYSARPGYSEHQTGLAFDVAANGCVLDCFGSTSQYTWLQQHAAEYGFIQRYYSGYESITGYKAEEWHYRYVGVEIAKDMQAKNVKTLEQYWKIEGGTY